MQKTPVWWICLLLSFLISLAVQQVYCWRESAMFLSNGHGPIIAWPGDYISTKTVTLFGTTIYQARIKHSGSVETLLEEVGSHYGRYLHLYISIAFFIVTMIGARVYKGWKHRLEAVPSRPVSIEHTTTQN